MTAVIDEHLPEIKAALRGPAAFKLRDRALPTLSGPRRLKKQSFNFLASGGVCKLPSRITQTGHGLSFHEAVRSKYDATPMAITTGMTTPPLANKMVTATRWPMD